jgi:Domain of unknown function (DUF6265)
MIPNMVRPSRIKPSAPTNQLEFSRQEVLMREALHLGVCVCLIVVMAAAQGAGKPPAKVTLDDLSFICGHNRGEREGSIIDEHWSEVGGDTMIGMYREIRNGKAQMYEFLTIEQTADGPVLRLRHFDPGLVGWEEKAQAASYPLASWHPNEAVFEKPDKSVRLAFRATSKETLEVTLERKGKKTDVFEYAHTAE